ncbi:MAG: hypothetical protein OXI10_07705 [Gammaproteobacteria bacterium]|nr:hypothetical protein [Gammaproteobacteria bacterium]
MPSVPEHAPGRWRAGANPGAVLIALVLTVLAWPVAAQQFQAPDIRIWEGGTAIFKFTLPSINDFAVRYAYRTRDGSALAEEDYQAKQGHVVFPAGIRRAEVWVRTLYDDDIVDNQYFELVLSDMQTRGLLRGSTAWTSAYPVKYLPATKTVRATIRNRRYQGPE